MLTGFCGGFVVNNIDYVDYDYVTLIDYVNPVNQNPRGELGPGYWTFFYIKDISGCSATGLEASSVINVREG
jgi:hypothetical protein